MWLLLRALSIISRFFNWMRLVRLPKHWRRVNQVRRRLRTIRGISGPAAAARMFSYVRAIEPLAFEELVLCAFEDAGAFVVRGRRYSGDGGMDGCLWYPRLGWYAVQTKRYSGHIKSRHVAEFQVAFLSARLTQGLFVHTGRTGAAADAQLNCSRVTLVSGDLLVALIHDRRFPTASKRRANLTAGYTLHGQVTSRLLYCRRAE